MKVSFRIAGGAATEDELLEPSDELDATAAELLDVVPTSEEEELGNTCAGEEEEGKPPIIPSEEDESSDPTGGLAGSVCGSGLLQVIRKNTNAAIVGRTLRFMILFINTPVKFSYLLGAGLNVDSSFA